MAPLSYRVLISEKNFLRVAQRARALPNGTNLIGIYYTENKLIFKTRSASRPKIIWTQVIEITDLAAEKILSATSFKDVQDLILNSGLKCDCNCEANLYWGYRYKAWKNGYGLVPEYRRPTIRNPYEKGYLCKHLYLALSTYPFWAPTIASKYLKHYKQNNQEDITTQVGDSKKIQRQLRNPYGVKPLE